MPGRELGDSVAVGYSRYKRQAWSDGHMPRGADTDLADLIFTVFMIAVLDPAPLREQGKG
jgi:hypothetical protein